MHEPNLREYEELLAARYVLGVATLAEISQVHARLDADGDFVERVAGFCELFSDVDLSGDTLTPPPELWGRIEAAIDDLDRLPLSRITPPPAGRWEPFAPGIERRPLQSHAPFGAHMILYRVAPGASFPEQDYAAAAECLLLDGDLEVGGVTMRTGDHADVSPLLSPGAIVSRTGALLYVRVHTPYA